MKKVKIYLFILVSLFFYFDAYSQVPDGISYQAVVRDAENKLVSYGMLKVRISVLSSSEDGELAYQEIHEVSTNENGLMSLQIGKGSATKGNFREIDWSADTYFIKTEIATDGFNYNITTVTQLLSVPYALHARTADEIKGTISFNDLTDVPTHISFSGDYNDLDNKPNIVDTVKVYGFSGNYNDLTNKPILGDNGFTGNYNDLSNKPNIRDSIDTYGFDGDYNSLENLPELFSGKYSDLTGVPNIKDSINTYASGSGSFHNDYNQLNNLPDIRDSIEAYKFDGKYTSLSGRPNLFSEDYFDLKNLPNIKDSITTYAANTGNFHNDYNQLDNLPNIRDSIETYKFDGEYSSLSGRPNLFSKDYFDLKNTPNIRDSIETYKFDGDYNKLHNVPPYFSGSYNDLYDRPARLPKGTQTGDILYWEEVNEADLDENDEGYEDQLSGWRLLPKGSHGMVLTVDENGKPKWENIANLLNHIVDAKYDTIYSSCSKNGMITPAGKIAVIKNGLAQFTITPNQEYGIDTVYIDSVAISLEGVDRRLPYSYTFTNVDTTHCIHAVFAKKTVSFSITYDNVTNNEAEVLINDEVVLNNSVYHLAAGGNISFTVGLSSKIGVAITLDEIDITKDVIFNGNTYNVVVGTSNRQVNIVFKKTDKTYAIGDMYPDADNPEGVVISVESGGEKGLIMNIQEGEAIWSVHDTILIGASDKWNGQNNMSKIIEFSEYPVFESAKAYGEGWYLPSLNELLSISNNFVVINSGLSKIIGATVLLQQRAYWSSTEDATDYSWGVIMGEMADYFYKKEPILFRVIKKFE